MTPTGTEARVCQDIAERQQRGIEKYGTTVEASTEGLLAFIKHAYGESLDLPIYLKKVIEMLEVKQSPPLQVEAGKWYERRDGKVVQAPEKGISGAFYIDGFYYWTTGCKVGLSPQAVTDEDLVREVPPPMEDDGPLGPTVEELVKQCFIEPEPKAIVYPDLSVGEGFRRLQLGESVQIGDQMTYDWSEPEESRRWRDVDSSWEGKIIHDDFVPVRRRVEPQYRPFASAEEFKPHANRLITDGHAFYIVATFNNDRAWLSMAYQGTAWSGLLESFRFDDDGQPCGVRL